MSFTADSCVSQKRENLRFFTFLALLRSYSRYLVDRRERRLILNQVSPSFGEKEISSCRLP